MKTEKEKMIAGEMHDSLDEELSLDRRRAFALLRDLNAMKSMHSDEYQKCMRELFPNVSPDSKIKAPVQCDYGYNIYIDEGVFVNYECIFLDCAPIRVGRNTLIAPRVQFYTAMHPFGAKERRSGAEWAEEITLGEDCWIGGGVIICPGVTIGDRVIVGAGSVVTKDIPPDSLAVGNPARVIRTLK